MPNIDISAIRQELGDYSRANNKRVREIIYNTGELSAHANTITKIDDEFPAMHSIGGRLIKQFRSQFDGQGDFRFKANILKTYHQKADVIFEPADVLRSWISSDMYKEKVPLAQKPISRYIIDVMLPKLLANDISFLEFKATFNDGTYAFGDSMDGILALLNNGLVDADNPMFRIPLNVLTDDNIVAEVTKFERNIPAKLKPFIKKICMSKSNFERYILNYEDRFGKNTDYTTTGKMKTRLGRREIVGFDGQEGSDLIWATLDDNLLKLIDEFNFPGITSIQELDRSLKILMEFHLGYGFWTNQLVLVSDYGGTTRGLLSEHSLYYPETPTTIVGG